MVICLTKYLLSDKHHLTKIWLAAHWEKKVKKAQIFEVDIEKSIQDIMEAEIILDLRISGHLLVGVVKIHSRKTKYLLHECSSIFYQVKFFHTRGIDLPDNLQTAPVNDITLDELFDNIDIQNDVLDGILTNQSHTEEITLKETNERLTLLDDADLEDFSFREEDEPFDNFSEDFVLLQKNLKDPENLIFALKENETSVNKKIKSVNSTLKRKLDALDKNEGNFDIDSFNSETQNNEIPESIESSACINGEADNLDVSSSHFNCETDNMNLEPVITSTAKSVSKIKKLKKRKLSVDYKKCMPYEVIKKHILDTSDITSTLELAPASKRLMILKEMGCAYKLFLFPAIKLQNSELLKLYQQNLKTQQSNNFELLSDEEDSFRMPRKRRKGDSHSELIVDEILSENFDESFASNNRNTDFSTENDIPILDNFMNDTEFEVTVPNSGLGKEIHQHLFPEIVSNNDGISSNEIQSTQVSQTSEEKWQFELQGRIVQMLKCLKLLFQKKSIIFFSSLVQNDKKLWVARKLLCLLMLKKFQVICLKQASAFDEVFISPDLNFDTACLKFC